MKLIFVFVTLISLNLHAIEFREDLLLNLSEHEMINQWDQKQKEKSLQTMEEAKKLALEILKRTIVKNKYQGGFLNQNKIFERVANRLDKVSFRYYEPGIKNKFCTEGVMAFAINYVGDSMNVCPIGLFQTKELLAQVFIHEATHLDAGGNECKATIVETISMHFAPFHEALKNGYWKTCETEALLEKVRKANQ